MEKTLGERIADLRKKNALRQEDLAEAVGVSAQAVSKWENDVSCPDIMLLPSLAEKLSVTVDELLTGKKDERVVTYLPKEERRTFDQMTLSIRVDSGDGEKVRVNIPLTLVKILLDTGVPISTMGGEKMNGVNVDWASIITLAQNGAIGKLVEVNSADGDVIEIVVG